MDGMNGVEHCCAKQCLGGHSSGSNSSPYGTLKSLRGDLLMTNLSKGICQHMFFSSARTTLWMLKMVSFTISWLPIGHCNSVLKGAQ